MFQSLNVPVDYLHGLKGRRRSRGSRAVTLAEWACGETDWLDPL